MRRIDIQLIKKISSGRCFLIVGAGASAGMGYPTWKQLAKLVFDSVSPDYPDYCAQYENSWENIQTDELLSFLEDTEKLIGRNKLVSIIQTHFQKIEALNKRSELYSIITRWPISCYITTNWDNEIKRHIPSSSPVFLEKGNTDKEMRSLTSDCPNSIYKIHGSFDNPERMIITKKDYNRVNSSPDYKVLREKLYNTLSMCPVVIIGYSAQDPDFKEQLERAKMISTPDQPVFMFSPDCSNEFIEKMLIKNNIRIIPYSNRDGKHSELLKILKTYNNFIALRGSRLVGRDEKKLEEGEDAAAFLIYNNTVLKSCSFNAILNVVNKNRVSLDQLQNMLKERKVLVDATDTKLALNYLVKEGFLQEHQELYTITVKGENILSDSEQRNDDIKDRFFAYCKSQLLKNNNLSNEDIDRVVNDINKGLELVFKKRGLEIARNVVNEEDRSIHLSFDILNSFLICFDEYNDILFENYIELLVSILQTPSKEVRDYFAILCNGYFVYYILGFGPDNRKKRLKYILNQDIYLDSNCLISLLAKNTPQNGFYVDLLNKVREINPALKVTRNLLKEVIEHAFWAITNFENATMNDFSVYQAGLGMGALKQNLFIDGAIDYSYQTGSMAIESYFVNCFGDHYSSNLESKVIEKLLGFGITVIDNKTEWDIGDLQQQVEMLKKDRLENDSYRNDFQCETEGELLYISEKESFAFITSAMNLQRLDYGHKIKHWSPELLYRFFQINDSSVEFDNLYNCMISDFYNCGIEVLSKEVMDNCSKRFYEQADINFEEIQRETSNQTSIFLSPRTIADAKRDYSYPFLIEQARNELLKRIELELSKNQQEKESIKSIIKEQALSEKERIQFERMKNAKKERQKKMKNKQKNKQRKK